MKTTMNATHQVSLHDRTGNAGLDQPLVMLSKILIGLWAVITVPGGLGLVFVDAFPTTIVWPPPLAPVPLFNAQLAGTIAIGTGVASILALMQNRWSSGQVMIVLYTVTGLLAEYVAIRRILEGPVPFQVYFYIALGIFYLVGALLVWRQQNHP